ncbi:hypothetical protein D3C77_641090 [compost metagenome]
MKRLAFVLKDFFACHVFGLQHTAFGRAVHVLDQIALQLPRQQGILLFDKRTGSGVGQVFDGLATQNGQFPPS